MAQAQIAYMIVVPPVDIFLVLLFSFRELSYFFIFLFNRTVGWWEGGGGRYGEVKLDKLKN